MVYVIKSNKAAKNFFVVALFTLENLINIVALSVCVSFKQIAARRMSDG